MYTLSWLLWCLAQGELGGPNTTEEEGTGMSTVVEMGLETEVEVVPSIEMEEAIVCGRNTTETSVRVETSGMMQDSGIPVCLFLIPEGSSLPNMDTRLFLVACAMCSVNVLSSRSLTRGLVERGGGGGGGLSMV
jgi:hypothetical protein